MFVSIYIAIVNYFDSTCNAPVDPNISDGINSLYLVPYAYIIRGDNFTKAKLANTCHNSYQYCSVFGYLYKLKYFDILYFHTC